MALHAIGALDFELWKGEPPRYHKQSVTTFARNGVDGTAAVVHAKRGPQFTSELTAWFANYDAARDKFQKYLNLIGSAPQQVKYEGRNLYALHKTKYLVVDVVEVSCQTNVRLFGMGINYLAGTSLVTRWTMIPIKDAEE